MLLGCRTSPRRSQRSRRAPNKSRDRRSRWLPLNRRRRRRERDDAMWRHNHSAPPGRLSRATRAPSCTDKTIAALAPTPTVARAAIIAFSRTPQPPIEIGRPESSTTGGISIRKSTKLTSRCWACDRHHAGMDNASALITAIASATAKRPSRAPQAGPNSRRAQRPVRRTGCAARR